MNLHRLALMVAVYLCVYAGTAAGAASAPVGAAGAAGAATEAPGVQYAGGALLKGIAYGDATLTVDTVWRGEVTVEGTLAVAPQATLRIEPGTLVHFRRSPSAAGVLMVQGRLVAAGTPEAPIVFSGSSTAARKGDWQGVMLLGTEKKNILENSRIEGARSGLEVLYSTVALRKVSVAYCGTGGLFQDAFVTMEGCSFSDCDTALVLRESEVESYRGAVSRSGSGVVVNGGSLYLSDGTLSGNRGTALAAQGARLKITGGSVSDNGGGMLLAGCEGVLSGVAFTGNGEVAVSLARSRMRVTGNEISKNGGIGLRVEDGAAVAWGNSIFQNGGCDLYNAGIEEFRAPGNWWGGGGPKVFDNGGRGAVLVTPVLGARPQK